MDFKNPSGGGTQSAAPFSVPPQPTPEQGQSPEPPNRKTTKLQLLKKYWYIPVIAVTLIILVAYLFVEQANTEKKWQKAQNHYEKAQYEQAAAQLKGVKMPGDEKRLTVYAQTMLATRQLDKALPAYESLHKKTKSPETMIRIGNIYNEQKKYDKAIDAYQSVIDSNSGNVQAYVNLATVYRLQNKPDAAITTAKKAIEANPNSVVLHELYVSMLLDNKNSPEYKKAVADLKKLNPEDPLLLSLEQ